MRTLLLMMKVRSVSPRNILAHNDSVLYLVLTWVSIYWFSRAGPAASCRIYYEIQKNGEFYDPTPPTIPMGVSFFPKELVNLPRS